MPLSTPRGFIGLTPQEVSARISEPIVEQHAEEAAILWTMRDAATNSPNYSLRDLAELDERVEAHLDGLRVAGDFGWDLCEKAMNEEEPGEIFAAAVLAIESGDTARIQSTLEIGGSNSHLQHGLISALGWPSFKMITEQIETLLHAESPEARLVAIGGHALHGRDPGSVLRQAIVDPNSQLRAQALRAAGELGRGDLLPALRKATSDPEDACRFQGAWSSARLGAQSAIVLNVLREFVEAQGPYAESALHLGLRCLDFSAGKTWLTALRSDPEQLRLAALGAGILGDPSQIPDLIALMEIEAVTRVAGEAFSMITGVDLAYEDLDGDPPEGFEAGPSENAEDEDVEMDHDEDLPWPIPEMIAEWWDKHNGEFRAGVRYLRGKEMALDSLQDCLVNGNQRQRAAAALELGLRNPETPVFEVHARGATQLRGLQPSTHRSS